MTMGKARVRHVIWPHSGGSGVGSAVMILLGHQELGVMVLREPFQRRRTANRRHRAEAGYVDGTTGIEGQLSPTERLIRALQIQRELYETNFGKIRTGEKEDDR